MAELEALARAYDKEDSAQRGEPSPWDIAPDDPEWRTERLGCAEVAIEAYNAACLAKGNDMADELPRFAIGDLVETAKGAKFWGKITALDADLANPGCTVLAVDPGFAGTKHVYPLKQLRTRLSRPSTADAVAGWQLVPTEPTTAMVYAAERAAFGFPRDWASHYEAMLEAAPTHPSPQGGAEPGKDSVDALARHLLNDRFPISDGAWRICEQRSDMTVYARRALDWLRTHPIGESGDEPASAYQCAEERLCECGAGRLGGGHTEWCPWQSSEWRKWGDAFNAASGNGETGGTDELVDRANSGHNDPTLCRALAVSVTSLRAERERDAAEIRTLKNLCIAQSVDLEVAESSLAAEKLKTAELEQERELFSEENRDNLALIDWIADKIGLPKTEELSRENFSAWSEQRVATLVGALNEIQEMARGWEAEGYSPVEAIDNIDAVAAKARATEA